LANSYSTGKIAEFETIAQKHREKFDNVSSMFHSDLFDFKSLSVGFFHIKAFDVCENKVDFI
jgi:hypothetical protein